MTSTRTVERDAVAYAIQQGVVVVAAMGNDNTSTPSFPGAYPDVIAVGATDPTDTRASFSQHRVPTSTSLPLASASGARTGMTPTRHLRARRWLAARRGRGGARPVVQSQSAGRAGRPHHPRRPRRPLRDNPADPVPNDNYGFGMVDAKAAGIGRVRRLRRGPSSPARASRSAARRSGKRARAWSRSARANRSVPVNRSPANRSAVRRSSPSVLRWASVRR